MKSDSSTCIIAEISANHNGSLDTALELVGIANPHFPFLIGAPSGILSEGEKANS
ncbi:MAG: hypothetical protein ACO3SO_05645 [Luteolibacter sp.]